MSLGVIMLVHTALGRAEQVARHWAASGVPVVIHVDKKVDRKTYKEFRAALNDEQEIIFSKRHYCEWGGWGITAATQLAAERMLERFSDVRHVFLASGSCLPLRPVSELIGYLDARPRTDFIESATTSDVPWTVGGLDIERFTLRFPFSWKTQRGLFDKYVALQRKIGLKRRIPAGLVPHMGSQWWCLTRQTLSAILEDPDRHINDRYFRKVWIPDESYFQTLARQYSSKIESRSLTLSKFDFQGKPHIFYDDHLQLLRRSDCFVARKIWPHADRVYQAFLTDEASAMKQAEPNPGKIDRIFSKAVERRTRGRPGLIMQSRFPNKGWENGVTCAPYSVFHGFTELFEDFEPWLSKATGSKVHGHIFAKDRAEFANGQTVINGGLSDDPLLRDYSGAAFLGNLIWNTRGEHQCFQFGPQDSQKVTEKLCSDANAQISVITGSWAVPLFRSNRNFSELRREAAKLQRIENAFLTQLRNQWTKARIRIWTMAEFIERPMEPLQTIIDEIGGAPQSRLKEAPKMADLTGFGQFLQNLKNQGMHPHLTGDFPIDNGIATPSKKPRRPYLVK
ncbi:beta-1,6-N-acetylglucosaminyltransferase [Planktotalea sp.]|uniref:DUF5927 domain-containing protein n=1 Tax=Planktotalea sp. TaxID=2029877 RepID=UPI003296FC9B